MRFSYLSHRREAKAQLILRINASSSEPCAVGGTKIGLFCIYVGFLYVYVSILTKCPVRS